MYNVAQKIFRVHVCRHAISEFKSCYLSGHNKCVKKHLIVDHFNCSHVKVSDTETNIEEVNLSLKGGRMVKTGSNKLTECSHTVQSTAQGNKLNVTIHP